MRLFDRVTTQAVPRRRQFLAAAAVAGVGLAFRSAWADETVDLGLLGGSGVRPIATAFPQKGRMILQRTRPPLLETPFEVFDEGVFTPNEQFFVRWHWAVIPTEVDVNSFRIAVRGHVNQTLSLSLQDLVGLPKVEMAAVNQCSGNSRGLFQPRVPGAQWGNGAMGNAKWTGVRLRDVLDRAGVKAGATVVRFNAPDQPVVDGAPDFQKSIAVDHARDGEVMLAYLMNDQPLPLLNGFPVRLVVPGWFSTYWVKMLNDIEVLDGTDDNYWMRSAYRIPDTPFANVRPGQTGFPTVPINRMGPRSFVTNLRDGASLPHSADALVRGIAFGGYAGVKGVDVSFDDGNSWQSTVLGPDEGKYGFRRWETHWTPAQAGDANIKVRCTNSDDAVQPADVNWNGGGFMRNVIETISVAVR